MVKEEVSIKTDFSSLEDEVRFEDNKDVGIHLKEIFAKHDPEHVIKNMVDICGTSKILENLQNVDGTPGCSQEVEQFCSKKVALKDILKNHTVDDLRQALIELTETNTMEKSDVIQNCFVPLLKLSEESSKMSLNGSKESLAVQLCNKDLISSNDLSSCIKSCLGAKKEEGQTDVMLDVFRYISENLSVEVLMRQIVQTLSSIYN